MIFPNEVLDVICDYYQLDQDILCNKRENGKHYRGTEYVNARQIFSYWCSENTQMSLKQIRAYMDMQDHSTMIHGRDKVQDKIFIYPLFRKQVEEIFQIIEQKSLNSFITEESCLEEILPSA